MVERAEFGERQAEMTARWFENVKRTHGDVDAYIATRHAAYLDRWMEAGRFIPDGAAVLDIGGGNLYEGLVNYFISRGFHYSYRDVDWGSVACAKDIAGRLGLNAPSIEHGFNDKLDFPDNSFDAVFSSHCIEHSIDLLRTFEELHRVIRPGGNLLMAVPFGWEANPEHPYFLGPNEWIALVQDAGFEIRIAQIGFEYPEIGADYFIAARKAKKAPAFRINPVDYRKESFTFVGPDDDSIVYAGAFDQFEGTAKSNDDGSRISIAPPKGAAEILPIFRRHSWSGRAVLTSRVNIGTEDLYSWFSYDMPTRPIPVDRRLWRRSPVTMTTNGKSASSLWFEMIFLGYMWR